MSNLKTVKKTNEEYAEIVDMTPEQAAKLLQANVNNRNLKPTYIKSYAKMMEAGKWHLNGETIKISKSGNLLDGQNRLHAVIKSGKTVKMFIAFNVDDDSFISIDSGCPRRYTDYLKVNGTNGDLNAISAASRIAMGFNKNGEFVPVGKISPESLLWWLDRHPGIESAVGTIGGKTNNICSRSIASALKYIFSQVDDVSAECFFDSVITGENLSSGSPVLVLRKKILQKRGGGGAGWTREMVYYFVTAFNAYRANKKVVLFRYIDGTKIILDGFKGQLTDTSFYVK